MSATAFWGQVAECRRCLRHLRRVRDKVRRRSKAQRWARTLVPWIIVPVLALPWGELVGVPTFVVIILLTSVLYGNTALVGGPVRLTAFEALRMPSRQALYVARLLPRLAWGLWTGLCGITGVLASTWPALAAPERVPLYLLIGAQVPWLLFGLVGTFSLADRVVLKRTGGVGCFLGFVAVGVVFGASPLALRQRLVLSPYLPLIPAAMLLAEVGLFAFQLWAIGRMEPMLQITGPVPMPDPTAGWKPSRASRRTSTPTTVGPLRLLSGRHGLGWASVYYALFRLRHDGVRGIMTRVALPVLLLVNVASIDDRTKWSNWYWVFFLIVACSASILHLDHPQRLYLLGVDYRRQLAHRLLTFWLTPAVVAVSAGALILACQGRQFELPLSLVTVTVALALFGEGWLRWPSMPQLGAALGCVPAVGLAMWLAYLAGAGHWPGLPDPGWSTPLRLQLAAASCAALGLVAIVKKLFLLDETRLSQLLAEPKTLPTPVHRERRLPPKSTHDDDGPKMREGSAE